MKEYINKQLEEQMGKMIDDLAHGNLEQIEKTFDTIQKFVLCDEKTFINGVKEEDEAREKEMVSIRKDFIKSVEKALEQDSMESKFAGVIQAFGTLQGAEQEAMGKYFNDLVQSVVSYKKLLDKGSKLEASPTDKIDELLSKKE